MRVLGQALSLASLGGIAAWRLSSESWRLLLRGQSTAAIVDFAWGYRAAMVAGSALALVRAWASLARGATKLRPFAAPAHDWRSRRR